MTPYLEKPLRTKQEAMRDTIAKLMQGETYLVIDEVNGKPYIREGDLGQTRGAVVYDLATGQYDFRSQDTGLWETVIGVLRLGFGEAAEDVTESVARDVLNYRIDHDMTHDGYGYVEDCPFLDRVMPDWREQVGPGRVDREYEKRTA